MRSRGVDNAFQRSPIRYRVGNRNLGDTSLNSEKGSTDWTGLQPGIFRFLPAAWRACRHALANVSLFSAMPLAQSGKCPSQVRFGPASAAGTIGKLRCRGGFETRLYGCRCHPESNPRLSKAGGAGTGISLWFLLFLSHRDRFDLHQGILRERRDLDAASGGERFLKELAVHGVEGLEVPHVL